MTFIENSTAGRPAVALVATRSCLTGDTSQPGRGKKMKVSAGYVRAVRLVAQADAGGLNAAKRELRKIVGDGLGKNWRIAVGTA